MGDGWRVTCLIMMAEVGGSHCGRKQRCSDLRSLGSDLKGSTVNGACTGTGMNMHMHKQKY